MGVFKPEQNGKVVYQNDNCIWIAGRFEGYTCNAIVTDQRFVTVAHESPIASLLIKLILLFTRQCVIFETPIMSLLKASDVPDGKKSGVQIETRFGESGKLRTDNVDKFVALLNRK